MSFDSLEGSMMTSLRTRTAAVSLGFALFTLLNAPAASAADDAVTLTPGMIFGPLYVGESQHAEVCFAYLSEGSIKAVVHFRNIATGEVTKGEEVSLTSGGGGCVSYKGKGQVVGMARGDGAAADWVSPSNALVSTMSVIDDHINTAPGEYRTVATVTVLGVAKLWVRGL
jgi:hypothetical protein